MYLEDRLELFKPHFQKNPSDRVLGRLLQIIFPNLKNLYGKTSQSYSCEELKSRTFSGIARKLKEDNINDLFSDIPLITLSRAVKYSLIGFSEHSDARYYYDGVIDDDLYEKIKITTGMIGKDRIISKEVLIKAQEAQGQVLIDNDEGEDIVQLVDLGNSAQKVALFIQNKYGFERNFKTIRRHYELKTGMKFPNSTKIQWKKKIVVNGESMIFIEYVWGLYAIYRKRRDPVNAQIKICNYLNKKRELFGFNIITFREKSLSVALSIYKEYMPKIQNIKYT